VPRVSGHEELGGSGVNVSPSGYLALNQLGTEGGSAGASFLPGAHTVLRRARQQTSNLD
jgi:hypothetical protein